MVNLSQEELISLMKENGLRITNHRLLILNVITKSREPLTVYELTEKVRRKENIDQATVYRNIFSFEEAGLIRTVSFNHGHNHYEFNTGKKFCRVVCDNCGTFEKLDGKSFSDLSKKIFKKSKKFKQDGLSSFEIYSLCKKCG